jgi:hypothetical protein
MLFRFTQLPIKRSRVFAHCAVACGPPLQQTFLGMRLRQDHLRGRAGARKSPGRDPPPYRSVRRPRRPVTRYVRVHVQDLYDRRHREAILAREFTIGSSESPSGIESSTSTEANYSLGPRRRCCFRPIRTAIGILAKHRLFASIRSCVGGCSTLRLAIQAGVSRTFETGWRRRLGPTWRVRASVTGSVGSGGATPGCMGTSVCSMTTESSTNRRRAAAPAERPHNPCRKAVQERVTRACARVGPSLSHRSARQTWCCTRLAPQRAV